MGHWVYEGGKHRQISADALAEEPEKWVIVRRTKAEGEDPVGFLRPLEQVFLRRRFNQWAKYEDWRKLNAPVMTFPTREEALMFAAGLVVTGQMEDGKYRFVKIHGRRAGRISG